MRPPATTRESPCPSATCRANAYLAAAKEASERLVKERYLLEGDLPQVMRRLEQQWIESTGASRSQ
jgi:hypothetical protein